jgi:hypothetical protein
MATFVATANAVNDANGTALSVTVTAAIKRGDLIAVWDKREGAATTSVVKDDKGNVYLGRTSPIRNTTNNDLEGEWWFAIAKNGSSSLVVTQTLAASRQFRRTHVLIFRPRIGYMFRLRPDQLVRAFGSSTTAISAGSLSTIGPGVGVLGVGEYAAATFTPGTGWTEANDNFSWTGYRIESEGGALVGNCTAGSAMDFVASFAYVQEVPIPSQNWWWALSSSGSTQSFSYTAAGGITLAGTSTLNRVRTSVAAGGLQLSGTSALVRKITPAPSGGLIFGGSSLFAKGFQLTAAGGLSLSGAASLLRARVAAPSGGLVFGGSSGYSNSSGTQTYSYTAVGGMVLAGTAALVRKAAVTAAGGLQLSGAAAINFFVVGATSLSRRLGTLLTLLKRR